jgi:hypothetical protein
VRVPAIGASGVADGLSVLLRIVFFSGALIYLDSVPCMPSWPT